MKLLAALMLFCVAASTTAQSLGQVVGSIVDQTGAPLTGVYMTIRGVAVRTADTGLAGDFAFPTSRKVTTKFALNGFQPQRRPLRVRAGERVTMSFTLRLAIVEEAIVTAARVGGRDVQAIPMSISAVSNAELGRLGTHTLGQAAALAPSVTLAQNAGFGQLTTRGIGANVLYAGANPSSAMYLDGVYLARRAMEFVQFLDLDRIEVLRGPQGTLHGRNAVGGAVNLISKAATNDFQASAVRGCNGFAANAWTVASHISTKPPGCVASTCGQLCACDGIQSRLACGAGAVVARAAYVPLSFASAEAFQFDWSEDRPVLGASGGKRSSST